MAAHSMGMSFTLLSRVGIRKAIRAYPNFDRELYKGRMSFGEWLSTRA